MFLNDDKWSNVEDVSASIKEVYLKLGDADKAKLPSLKTIDSTPLVESIRKRKMQCYPGWKLFEFKIDVKQLPRETHYQQGAVYALVSNESARVLDGESSVIHDFNKQVEDENGKEKSVLQLSDEESFKEYLRFFCTFVAGNDGPFLIVEENDDLQWKLVDEQGNEDQEVNFEDTIETKRKDFGWGERDIIPLEDDDVSSLLNKKSKDKRLKELKKLHGQKAEKSDPVIEKIKVQKVPGGEDSIFKADADVLYGRYLFRAHFQMDLNGPIGMVEMIDDEPKCEKSLPVYQRNFDENYPILFLQGERKRLSAKEFIEMLLEKRVDEERSDEENKGFVNKRKKYYRNFLIEGDIDLSGTRSNRIVTLDDVQIDGDVIIDDLRSKYSLYFKNVIIRGRLHAKHMRCEGSFVLKGCKVYGYYDKYAMRSRSHEDYVALSLRGADISSILDLSNTLIRGGVDLDDIEVFGTTTLSGIDIDRREPLKIDTHKEQYPVGLSVQGARFNRELQLTVYHDHYLPSSDSIPPRIVGGIIFDGSTVDGSFDISGIKSKVGIIRYRYPFEYQKDQLQKGEIAAWDRVKEEPFIIKSANTGDISLQRMTIKGELSAEGITVEGHILASTLTVNNDIKLGFILEDEPRKIIGTKIKGTVVLTSAKIGGSIDAHGITVDNQFLLTSAEVRREVNFSSVIFSEKIQQETSIGKEIKDPLDPCMGLWSTKINGSVSLCGTHLYASINVAGATINGILDGNPVEWLRTRIEGDVDISGATINSDIRFCGAKIKGLFQAITGNFKRIQLRLERIPSNPANFDNEPPVRRDDHNSVPAKNRSKLMLFLRKKIERLFKATLGVFKLTKHRLGFITSDSDKFNDNRAQSEFKLVRTHVGGMLIQTVKADSLDFYMLQVHSNKNNENDFAGSVDLKGVNLDNDFNFFNERPDRYLLPPVPEQKEKCIALLAQLQTLRPKISKKLEVNGLTLGGDLNLTNLEVGENITLGDIQVGDLTARPNLTVDSALQLNSIGVKGTDWKFELKANELNMDRLLCNGDIRVSGINIKKDFSARSIKVADGIFQLTDEDTKIWAKIGGQFDITASTIDSLEISGKSFRSTGEKQRPESLIMERAKIAKLILLGPTPFKANLCDLKVEQIETKSDITDLLSMSKPFNRAIYRTAEKLQRDHGSDAMADKIYRQMRWRSLDPKKEPLMLTSFWKRQLSKVHARIRLAWIFGKSLVFFRFRIIKNVLTGFLTGFWTMNFYLLFIILTVTLPLSYYIVSNPDNISPSTTNLGEIVAEKKNLSKSSTPDSSAWTTVEQAKVITNLHVPIIPLVNQPRWELAANRKLCIADTEHFSFLKFLKMLLNLKQEACPENKLQLSSTISPAAYGLIVSIIHWIVWPIFLIGISGLIQRKGNE